MKEIKTKFGATIYAEELSHDRHYADREDESKIKFFDSNKRYLDYFETSTIEENALTEGLTPEEWLDNYVKELESCKTITDLCDTMGFAWAYIASDWRAVAAYMVENGYLSDNIQPSVEAILDNEWVNVLGEKYIVITEC